MAVSTTLLRLGYTGLVGLLGCSSGAFAAKQRAIPSSSRVAFTQHGVAEGEDTVMHSPASSQKAAFPITPPVLSSAIARVMSMDGARSECEWEGLDLPAGDIFNRPDGNVLVFVDGVRSQGSRSTPFVTEWLQEPWYNLRTPTEDSFTSALESTLGASFQVAEATLSKDGLLCASVDPALESSHACSSAEWVLTRESARAMVWDNDAKFGPGVKADLSTGLRTLRLTGGDAQEGAEAVLDLGVEADLFLAEELSFLALLPQVLNGRFDGKSSPPLLVIYLSSLKAIRKTYGERSVKGSLAYQAFDASLAEAFHAMSTAAGRRLTSQLVVGPYLREKLAHGGRRLQTEENSTSTTGNYSLVDIKQYQLNLWTGVFMVMLGFLAIYATVTMDVQPDSLLYAKFITDTSGSGLKTD